jgi:hypothetical protein
MPMLTHWISANLLNQLRVTYGKWMRFNLHALQYSPSSRQPVVQTSAALSASCVRAPALRPSQSLARPYHRSQCHCLLALQPGDLCRLGVPHPEELRVLRLTGDDRVVIRGISGTTGR